MNALLMANTRKIPYGLCDRLVDIYQSLERLEKKIQTL